MSGTINCPAGFFQNDTVTPAVIGDLESAVTNALATVDGSAASAATATAQAAIATTQAVNSANSAAAAAASATASATSATSAAGDVSTTSTNATNAAASASSASGSATAASNSATTAAGSATTAGTDATNSGNSATAAASSATNAASSATAAASSATAASTSAANAVIAAGTVPNVGRNKLHNSTFIVASRGVGPWTAAAYTADRWAAFGVHSNGSMSVSVAALTDAIRAQIGDEEAEESLKYVFTGGTGAGDIDGVTQKIEDVRRLSNKTVTVSFWAAAASGTPKVGVGLAQNFGTGGSPSSVVFVAAQVVTLSTTWTRYTKTFSVPSISGKTVGTNGDSSTELDLWLSSGSTNNATSGSIGVQSATVSFWGVQLEVGAAATPLEKRDYQMEVALCGRFYQTGAATFWGYAFTGSTFGGSISLSPPMRATPTAAIAGSPTLVNCASPTAGATAPTTMTLNAVASSTAPTAFAMSFTASADL